MINRILYWWHKRKLDKYLARRKTNLSYMILMDDPGLKRTTTWLAMFEDTYINDLRKLKQKYKI